MNGVRCYALRTVLTGLKLSPEIEGCEGACLGGAGDQEQRTAHTLPVAAEGVESALSATRLRQPAQRGRRAAALRHAR